MPRNRMSLLCINDLAERIVAAFPDDADLAFVVRALNDEDSSGLVRAVNRLAYVRTPEDFETPRPK